MSLPETKKKKIFPVQVCSAAGRSCSDGSWGIDSEESMRAALAAAGQSDSGQRANGYFRVCRAPNGYGFQPGTKS